MSCWPSTSARKKVDVEAYCHVDLKAQKRKTWTQSWEEEWRQGQAIMAKQVGFFIIMYLFHG